jgi:hypothetical protein
MQHVMLYDNKFCLKLVISITIKYIKYIYVGCRHIYICKDNHLSNCSIIFITIVQYTQMYLNN